MGCGGFEQAEGIGSLRRTWQNAAFFSLDNPFTFDRFRLRRRDCV
jgi:hypothetical protein